MVKLIVFDMDGTLIDTDKVLIETWRELFLTYKDKDYVVDEEMIRGFSGPPIEQSIKKAFPEYPVDFILKRYREVTPKYYDKYLKVYPEELEVLKRLKDEGYILTIATSKNRAMAIKCLEMYKILDYFSYIITSSDGFPSKPDPTSINFIIDKFKVNKDECLMIGDTKFDYLASYNANIKCILFNASPRTYEENIKPIFISSSYKEIYKFIKNI